MQNLITVKKAAEILQVHPHSIYRMISNKAIPFIKLPGVGIRFDY